MSQLNLKPNPDEVELLFTISFEDLLDQSKWTHNDFATPIFHGNNCVVWGLTAYLLHKFLTDVVLKCSVTLNNNINGEKLIHNIE